jgi:SAM-dependent methyltransferase
MPWILAGLLCLALGGLWILVPAWYGLAWVPTRAARIRKALQLAGLSPGETLYDLGSGDGRVLIIAAREFGARAVGLEVGPLQAAVSLLRAALSGTGGRVRVRLADFYRAELGQADVVFIYATSRQALRLQASLAGRLRAGARLVSVSADFPGWLPSAYDHEDLIFLYRMPPAPGSLETFLAARSG